MIHSGIVSVVPVSVAKSTKSRGESEFIPLTVGLLTLRLARASTSASIILPCGFNSMMNGAIEGLRIGNKKEIGKMADEKK